MSSSRVVRVHARDDVAARTLRAGIVQIQSELKVEPAFAPEVEEAAGRAAAAPRLPDLDRTDIPFVTIDPPSSMDLDQALHLERKGSGYVVHYAIADVAAFVEPGDPVDAAAHERGETLYGADSKIPLHPTSLSEDAASLLPDQVRPSLLWTIQLDETGEGTDVHVERARVRSRAKLDYEGVQKAVDDGSADEVLMLLKEVGELRLQREAARGGISLPLPEQEVEVVGDQWSLEFRSMIPAETWNAQISMLTGFAAASLMVYARVGLLRTLPPPQPRDLQKLHRVARALHIDWPAEQLYPDFIRGLDSRRPAEAAMITACARLLRGSGYVAFDGDMPADPIHAALASEYAHVTAPLRRLGDRYAGEICLALCAGTDVPTWVLSRLAEIPDILKDAGRKAAQYESMVLSLVEAGVLHRRVGEAFDGVVTDVDEKDDTRGKVTIQEPAVEARVTSAAALPLGTEARVRLTQADVDSRSVAFELG
ncbi:MAG TPA: RNB domain-containing ribonuclease [Nocardioides sp.]|jgi:exoribonuclease R|nr:RNB domain-containing ribonuclease [Nocardioides sp.]